jgi:quinol-cytochrome oxidoreductase complex cytochrome b subunit
MLRPGPEYSLNVFYWLGALMVMAFIVQGITGLLMLLYYTPTVDQAYLSTLFIINNVPLGRLLETIHLYSAYAMILLAFMHLMRGYFVSVQKKPREFMWVVGMLMGVVVLGFGLTGYLLPWTVVSKSATDVTIGMLSFLPGQLGPTLRFLIAGPGSDAAELARFFDLHIVVLPAVFTLLLAFKMYMFEIHGAAEPSNGSTEKARLIPWFPNIFLYFSIMSSVFIAALLTVSVLLPISLPPPFSPETAASYTPQPEWYFLWLYQILKFSAFEGAWIVAALAAITIGFALIVLLPFFDTGRERNPARRPLYVTLGMIILAEIIVLAIWGYLTPGRAIPDSQATTIVVGIAVVIAIMSWMTYKTRRILQLRNTTAGRSFASFMGTPFRFPRATLMFTLLLLISSAALASVTKLLASPQSNAGPIAFSGFIAVVSSYLMASLVKEFAIVSRGGNRSQ